MPRLPPHAKARSIAAGSTGIGAQPDRAPSRPWSREVARAPRVERARGLPGSAERGKSKAKKASPVPMQGACRRPRKEKSRTSVNPPPGTPPPARRSSRSTRTRASRSRTWARSTSSSTTRWTGTPRSTRCSPAPTLKYGRDQEWVCALRTRSIRDTGVCLGFLGSSGGHAAVSYFVCAKPTALGGVS